LPTIGKETSMARHVPGPLYVEQLGATGTPMLFLHSTPDDHRLWLFQTAHFSAHYRTIAVDVAGYGRSPAVQDGVTPADQAQACWETVDRIATGAIIIQGNSMGAGIATAMAHQHRERVKALILSGCGYTASNEVFLRWVERYATEGIALRHEQVLDHLAPASRANPMLQYYARMVVELNNAGTLASIIAMNKGLAIREPESYYRSVSVPTLIITGKEDRSYPSALVLQKLIPGCELKAIDGVAHAPMIEAPWEYDRHAIEFLTKLGLYPGEPS
jgi:pimeloyl-ACP methyl ester carboxylesterase